MKAVRKSIQLIFMVLVLSVSVLAAEERLLVPGGHTIGMKAYAQGLVVTSVEEGSPAHRAGIRQGDILCKLDEMPLQSAEQLTQSVAQGRELRLRVSRGDAEKTVTVKPTCAAGTYRLGAYVRNSVGGIGTVTYYDPQTGEFGALGHGISEQNGRLFPIAGGDVVSSRVHDVVKGVSGTAGQLRGEYDLNRVCGTFEKNTPRGVFGTIAPQPGLPVPVAQAEEVRAGKAIIRSNVRGDKVETYEIEIVKCYGGESQDGRNLLIRITDENLLAVTGGIVQGMSGSPIIQNGKLVGAVTHVLVNNPELGYGIFIENMLEAAA